MTTVPLLSYVARAAPRLDRAGVEAARLIRVARDRLVTESPSVTYELLAQARGTNENTARQWVLRRRSAGTIITVDHDGTVLMPAFQFDDAYDDVIPEVAAVTSRLTEAGMSGWAIWSWFDTVNPWIERSTAELIGTGQHDTLADLADRLADPEAD
ncbi:hypothetical protein BH24ACT4_BH24ACT4_05960 [soil metagenome]